MVSDLQLVVIQTGAQLRSVSRNRRAVIFSVVFPLVMLVLFNSIFVSGGDSVELDGARVGAQAYFTGGMIAYAMMFSAFTGLALGLVQQRESGQLKRYRGTPVPAWTFIVATVLRATVMVGLMAVVILATARLAYGVAISGEALAEIALYVLLGTATMCGVGIAATTVATDVDSASAALPLAAVLLSFISSIFIPIDQLPDWLAAVGRIFPLYHVAIGFQTALGTGGDTALDWGNAAALAAWAVCGGLVAARGFRWEPQAASA